MNTRDKNYTPGAIRLRIEQVDASIARYLGMLDTADHQDRALLAAADQVSARLAAALDGEHGADIIGLARSAAAK